MKTYKVLTRVEFLKVYFKALLRKEHVNLEILRKANIFAKYFIFLRCEACSGSLILITEKDVISTLTYDKYIIDLYAECPDCGKGLTLDILEIAHMCVPAYKYFNRKAYKSYKKDQYKDMN